MADVTMHIVTCLAETLHIIESMTDIVMISLMVSALVVGFLYVVAQTVLLKAFSFLPFI